MRYSSLASRVGVMILRRLHLHGNTTTLKGGHHEWVGICVLDENYLLVCFGTQETMGNLKQMSAKPFSETQDIIFNIIMVFKILTSLPHCYNALFRAHYHHDNNYPKNLMCWTSSPAWSPALQGATRSAPLTPEDNLQQMSNCNYNCEFLSWHRTLFWLWALT